MSNFIYPKGKQHILEGSIAYLTDTIKCALVTTSYPANSADEFYSSVSAYVVGTPTTLTSRTSTGGVADAADITFNLVAMGSTLGFLVIYKDTGSGATSPLIALINNAAVNGNPAGTINVATDGGNIVITWSGSGIFAL